MGYFALRRMVTVPLDRLIRAAQAVEDEEYEMGALDGGPRRDELGRLASVFEDMVTKLATRRRAGQLHASGRHQGRR